MKKQVLIICLVSVTVNVALFALMLAWLAGNPIEVDRIIARQITVTGNNAGGCVKIDANEKTASIIVKTPKNDSNIKLLASGDVGSALLVQGKGRREIKLIANVESGPTVEMSNNGKKRIIFDAMNAIESSLIINDPTSPKRIKLVTGFNLAGLSLGDNDGGKSGLKLMVVGKRSAMSLMTKAKGEIACSFDKLGYPFLYLSKGDKLLWKSPGLIESFDK